MPTSLGKGGNLHIEYFGPAFGWTTSAKVADWFKSQYETYFKDNSLKYRAMEKFHGHGKNKYNLKFHRGKWLNEGHVEIKLT